MVGTKLEASTSSQNIDFRAVSSAFYMDYSVQFYDNCRLIPTGWDAVVAKQNILLSKAYFCVLEESSPTNMQCYYIGFFKNEKLIGGAILQYLDFRKHQVLQKDKLSCSFRNFLTQNFGSNVLILGNNMLTGQNGFYFDIDEIQPQKAAELLNQAVNETQKKIKKTSIIIFKDYRASTIHNFSAPSFKSYFKFSVQPNMILDLKAEWKSLSDYSKDLSKKYRVRLNSARKKNGTTVKRELNFEEVKIYSKEIYCLYKNVAQNADFNTFFLAENHFESLKYHLKDKFKIFGYFLEDKLVGFYTLMLNQNDIDTYFLGYNAELQKEKQLYLNMLFDMLEFGINWQYERVIFGRTALEIKSTIGAEPVELFGLIKHNNSLINLWMNRIFPSIEPKVDWVQRRPFKENG